MRSIVESFIYRLLSLVFLGRFLLTILGLISGFLILRFSSTRSNFSVSSLSGSHFLLYLFGFFRKTHSIGYCHQIIIFDYLNQFGRIAGVGSITAFAQTASPTFVIADVKFEELLITRTKEKQ